MQGKRSAKGKEKQGQAEQGQREEALEENVSTSRSFESPKKKQKTPPRKGQLIAYAFNERQEEDLAEWLRDHECLYNRKLKAYKNTAMKQRLIADKAKEFDPECSGEYCISFIINLIDLLLSLYSLLSLLSQ